MTQHAFMIDLDNKPGGLAEVTEAIAAKGVNILSVSGSTYADKGRVAIVTDDNAQTRAALADINCTFEQKEITSTALPHQPGSLAKAARQLASAGVNIESVLLLGMQGQDIEVGFVTSDPVMAKNALSHVGSATG
jgi:hypothetical protein